MTDEQLADSLIPLAAELVGTVRDYGPEDVRAVLARVPAGRHDALAVILAAMVDPDRTPVELLAWTSEPVQSREGFTPGRRMWAVCPVPECSELMRQTSLSRHLQRAHSQPVDSPGGNVDRAAS